MSASLIKPWENYKSTWANQLVDSPKFFDEFVSRVCAINSHVCLFIDAMVQWYLFWYLEETVIVMDRHNLIPATPAALDEKHFSPLFLQLTFNWLADLQFDQFSVRLSSWICVEYLVTRGYYDLQYLSVVIDFYSFSQFRYTSSVSVEKFNVHPFAFLTLSSI